MAIYKKNQATVRQNHTKKISADSQTKTTTCFQFHWNLLAASNLRVLVEYYSPKQAPNLLFGQKLPVSILT